MSQQRFEEMGSKGGCGQGRRLGDASRQWWVARRYLACVLLLVLFISGCAIFKAEMDLPPLLAQDEVVRPFTKLAVVQVSRQRFGTSYDLKTEDYGWAYEALREEAAKIGADAVIFSEVKLEASSYLLFPMATVDARGTAIRFR
ncbi:YbjQ family protein [Geotalea toluenoxydans]|uniref:hypothetical protein n=1 Tax=Geotalea toluenoxydans TaxID=421624 RepID=UPI0006D1BB1F|nr:hypothetical protein [Geotalea toluenoxydans]